MNALAELTASLLDHTYISYGDYDSVVKVMKEEAPVYGSYYHDNRPGYLYRLNGNHSAPWIFVRHSVSKDAKITGIAVAPPGIDWVVTDEAAVPAAVPAGAVEVAPVSEDVVVATYKVPSSSGVSKAALEVQLKEAEENMALVAEHSPKVAELLGERVKGLKEKMVALVYLDAVEGGE